MNLVIKKALEQTRKFENLMEITGGANAYAFRARHCSLNEERFLKCIPLVESETDAILNEPQTLTQLLRVTPKNSHLVELHDADIIEICGERYVILQMEFVTGDSLQHQLENQIFGQQDAIRITQGIVRGLKHLHKKRIVHRDLKPGNIMLVGGHAKITDFGSVARIPDAGSFVKASKHSDLYRPPEAWKTATYGFQSDLYQIGLVLYQLVNGPLHTSGSQYLTQAVKKALKDDGKTYAGLHECDKQQWEKKSFAELTHREAVLDKGGTPRPYMARSVNRLIQDLVKADLTKRIASADDLQLRLSKISTPNWKPQEAVFEAADWKDWDWRVRSSKGEFVAERSQCGANSFRRFHTAPTQQDAFRFVEEIS